MKGKVRELKTMKSRGPESAECRNYRGFRSGREIHVDSGYARNRGCRKCQEVLCVPDDVGEHTLEPTKHPPDGAATHSNPNPCKFRFDVIFLDSTLTEDLARQLKQWTTLSQSGRWTTQSQSGRWTTQSLSERRRVNSTAKEDKSVD